TPGSVSKVEGTVAAVNAAANTVDVRLASGNVVTVTAGAATKIERNDAHVALAAFQVGDRAKAVIGPDGVAWEIEAEGAAAPGTPTAPPPADDDGTPAKGSGDAGGTSGSNSGSGSGQTETRVEGAITA